MESIIRDVLNGTGSFKDLDKKSTEYPPIFAQHQSPPVDADANEDLRRKLPTIQVIGVGGAGNNAIDRLMALGVEAECLAINTDAQHLLSVRANKKLLIGKTKCQGYGAGNIPAKGEEAARESAKEIEALINGDMVFITCGLGGGTGTGAAPVIAKIARDKKALTVSVCTLPFNMEGKPRYENAKDGLKKLFSVSDTVVIVPNEKLLCLSNEITMVAAFKIADEVLVRAVKAVTELITKPQLINLDFADVKRILSDGGLALIGLGESSDQKDQIKDAVSDALKNPLLSDLEIKSAKKALVCVSGGEKLSLKCAEEAVTEVVNEIDKEAEIIWGAAIDQELGDALRLIVILSNVESSALNSNGEYNPKTDLGYLLGDTNSSFSVYSLNNSKSNRQHFNDDKPIEFNSVIKANQSTKSKKKFFGLF